MLGPVRDAAALQVNIERLVGDPELRASMGRAARMKAKRDFDQQTVIDTARALCARCYEMVGEAGRQDEQRRDIFRRLPEMMGVEVENWDASGDTSEDGDVKSDSEVSL